MTEHFRPRGALAERCIPDPVSALPVVPPRRSRGRPDVEEGPIGRALVPDRTRERTRGARGVRGRRLD
jgi:hypothetical protein